MMVPMHLLSGASQHSVDQEIVFAASLRKHAAKQTHLMMIEILKTRLAAEGFVVEADRGSEPGDFFDHDLDEMDISADLMPAPVDWPVPEDPG